MSTKKKFDLTTLFVILISISLILLGMYFLNQSFTKKTGVIKQDTTTSQKANVTITAASSSNVQSSIVVESAQSLSSALSISSASSTISSSSSLVTSATTSSKNTSPLSTSEAKIKVLQNLGGGSYEVEIIESGIKDPKFWIKDKKLKINNNSSLKIDSEYRVGEITETPNSFNYGSIEE